MLNDYWQNESYGVRGFWSKGWNDNVIIMVNGVDQISDYFNDYPLTTIAVPVEAIDKIEVVRGPMSVIYGSGAFFGAINIGAFMPIDEFKNDMDDMIKDIKSARLAKGFKEILIAGEPEYRVQQKRLKSGIPLDDSVWKELMDTVTKLDVDTSGYQVEDGGVSLHPSYTLEDRYT